MKKLLLLFCLFTTIGLATKVLAQTPTITSFTPLSAKPGDVVTLTGTNFNTTAANNIVFFGATKANVTAATAASLILCATDFTNYLVNNGTNLEDYSLSIFTQSLTA